MASNRASGRGARSGVAVEPRPHACARRGHPKAKPDADEGAKLKFLLDEARRTQERLNELDKGLEQEHVRRVNALNDLRTEFDAAINETVETSRFRFLQLRRIGLALLLLGGGALAAANLVSPC
jgi:hypothetical protein